jgi:dienelactone hydrolase
VRVRWSLVLCVAVVGPSLTAAVAFPYVPKPLNDGAVKLTVSPTDALLDQPVDMTVSGLRPGQQIALVATTRDGVKRAWHSRLLFSANESGVVDTRSNMKLFWSMRPVKRASASTNFSLSLGAEPITIRAQDHGRTVASATLVRRIQASDVTMKETTVATEGFVGTYFSPAAGPPAPAVLRLSGSLGGHSPFRAALLASHGYPTLSLGYIREPSLPTHRTQVPFEYFANALRWLAAQPGVDPKRIIVLGVSLGGEVALLLGATYPDLVHGVVACTTNAQVTSPSWTVGGQTIPYGPIPVERIAGPALVTGGGKDAALPSAIFTQWIVERARTYGRTDIVGRIYPKAGHGVGCDLPNVPPSQVVVTKDGFGRRVVLYTGGTRVANALAAEASVQLVPRFLRMLP